MKNSDARIPALDGLRGLAILMVMLFHFSLNLDGHAWVENAFRSPVRDFGWTGVDLFFVLSGFLITGILVDARGARNYFSAFYARRALRIFPLYYFSLAAIWLVFRHLVARPSGVIWYAIYAQNWLPVGGPGIGHFWSLAVEEQFYLVWPLIVYTSSRRRVLQLSVAGIIFANILRVLLWEHGMETYIVYANPFTRMDALLAGAACACLARDSVWVERFRRHVAWLRIAPPLGVIGALALMKFTPPLAPHWTLFPHLGYPAVPLAYGAMLLSATLGGRSWLQSFLVSSPMRTLGRYSYAMYVWHYSILSIVPKVEAAALGRALTPLVNIPILIGVSLAAAVVSYVVIERPFLALKRRFEPRSEPAPALRRGEAGAGLALS